jgi:hypothetical protein
MGIATHLGPWLLGTVKDRTGNTSTTTRNLGATVVAQTKAIAFGDAAASVAFCLPAGSLIISIQVATSVAYSSAATVIFSGNGTALNAAATITSLGNITITPTASTAVQAYLTDTGRNSTFVTYTISGTSLTTGNSIVTVQYVVRNFDGTI